MFYVVFRSLTMMLVTVSIYSLVTMTPRIYVEADPNVGASRNLHGYFAEVWTAKIIAPWNYCGNFFFYVLSGKEFRKELRLMFHCLKRSSGAFVFDGINLANGPKSIVIRILKFYCLVRTDAKGMVPVKCRPKKIARINCSGLAKLETTARITKHSR